MKLGDVLKRVKSKYGLVVLGILIFSLFIISFNMVSDYTSTDRYCVSCHIHPVQDQNWRLSEHYNNKSGFVTPLRGMPSSAERRWLLPGESQARLERSLW